MRTLIVEDDFTSRLLLQTFLARYGECHVAMNGNEAVEAFRLSQQNGNAYDLICMDIMMPEMDGQEAVLKIRQLEESAGVISTSGAKIIMITALDDVKNVVESFKALCDAYIFKPVDTTKLLHQLRALALVA
jgi:two-component system, chemotaxis family, chemotaxis protein CheY